MSAADPAALAAYAAIIRQATGEADPAAISAIVDTMNRMPIHGSLENASRERLMQLARLAKGVRRHAGPQP